MDLELTRAERDLQGKARAFAEEILYPYEEKCDDQDGLEEDDLEHLRSEVLSWDLNAINHDREYGGQGLTIFEQLLVSEQLGRATGALWDVAWQPAYPLRFGTPQQIETYLVPTNLGQRRDAYAITEAYAGSDPRQVRTRADRCDGGYRINGEKWFVTLGDIADYILVHTHVEGDPEKPTIFLVDKDAPGVRLLRTPRYTHHFVYKHPEFAFEDVVVGDEQMLGEIGSGFDFTKDWFVEARLGIAARCVGAATRATELANAFAAERQQFGKPIRDFQAIEFMLADMAVEIMAAKSMLYRVGWEITNRPDRKLSHARAAAVKLHCSELAGRVLDRAVQIFGGRGYMRENPVERLNRDVRVDRIWEGTSEIQRVIIGGQLKKRGLDVYTNWA